jgi:microcystin-dependent protein
MSDPFIGEIRMFGGNFAPRGWALCDGQLLAISNNQALFSILGTTYGGDGRTTFGLPDLRGRFALHSGTGPGLSSRRLGDDGGAEQVTLSETEMPGHTHGATVAGSGQTIRTLRFFGQETTVPEQTTGSTGPAGGDQPHDNMPPFQAVNFIIALQGIFPSRN